MTQEASLRTKLKHARGLGAAKTGVSHWWMQRVTAIALVPLSLYFLYSLLTMMTGQDEDHLAGWLAQPHAAMLMVLFIIALFVHAKLGVQVIIEDYVHTHGMKFVLLLLNSFTCWLFAAMSILAVVRLHFLDLISSSL